MRKALLILSFIVVIIVAGVVSLPHLLDMNRYKSQITELVEEHTNRKVRLDGEIKLQIFPNIALNVADIHLLQEGEEDLAYVKQLTLRVALLPLISKQVNVESLVLDGVKASLKLDKNGEPNWIVSHVSASDKQEEAEQVEKNQEADVSENEQETAAAEQDEEGSPASIALEEVIIRNALIDFKDEQTKRHIKLEDLSLATDFYDGKSNLELSGKIASLKAAYRHH